MEIQRVGVIMQGGKDGVYYMLSITITITFQIFKSIITTLSSITFYYSFSFYYFSDSYIKHNYFEIQTIVFKLFKNYSFT